MNVLATVIRPTEVVRRLMYAHGASPSRTFTNSYDNCRTVKCYVRQIRDADAFARDLLDMYTKLELGCPQTYSTPRGLIVRIPRSLQG